MRRVDAGGLEELGRLARPGQLPHGEDLDPRSFVRVCERRQHALADPALGPVVFDRDEASLRRLRSLAQARNVDRLHGVEVDHTRADPVLRQLLRGFERFVQCDPGGDDRHLVVVGGTDDLAPSEPEVLVRAVDDRCRAARRADE